MAQRTDSTWARSPSWGGSALPQTHSERMRQVLDKVRSVAPTRTTILLTGETGAGKGLMARAVHQLSHRAEHPFLTVHCGAIPETLLESELFGHEKGAFTGATRRKLGKFELADGGTLFLDEIATVTASAQVKLLNVLQDRKIQRLGGEQEIDVDVRLIAATNSDLALMAQEGSFRKDLYYRLHVFPIELPPLRDRSEDVPGLVQGVLAQLNAIYGKEIAGVHEEVLRAFRLYSWPGNIRELENVLERAYVLESGPEISPDGIPLEVLGAGRNLAAGEVDGSQTLAAVRRAAVENAERRYLKELLARNQGRIDQSARAAGITSRQLHNLLTRHGIRKEDFKRPGSGGREG